MTNLATYGILNNQNSISVYKEVLILKEEQIIEVARELFHKFGFKKVSMDEIAREAGVTKKTIYRYFDSKEALLEYFIQEELQNMKAIVE